MSWRNKNCVSPFLRDFLRRVHDLLWLPLSCGCQCMSFYVFLWNAQSLCQYFLTAFFRSLTPFLRFFFYVFFYAFPDSSSFSPLCKSVSGVCLYLFYAFFTVFYVFFSPFLTAHHPDLCVNTIFAFRRTWSYNDLLRIVNPDVAKSRVKKKGYTNCVWWLRMPKLCTPTGFAFFHNFHYIPLHFHSISLHYNTMALYMVLQKITVRSAQL